MFCITNTKLPVLFAKSMGAKVFSVSYNDKKRKVSKELGFDNYINTDHHNFHFAKVDDIMVNYNTNIPTIYPKSDL
ncbi:hypothetical protein MAM1_0021c01817 [Mucor ambiguus]|uniref:Uncharacterized protein n=1 Tax=Mucor ambiguus TaxID=91626 RepID=A0A0C9M6I3_9FUNG|nr:hypothetical protein MAM1_0021c01817 [Mucor ambiguus]